MAYFELGKFLCNKIKEAEWGSRAIESLAKTIAQFYPELKRFTRSGLYRMIQFYETYSDNIIVAPLVRQISWTNNIVIFSHQSSLVDYRRWFFGHYHFDVSVGKRKGCIYQRIIKLEKIGQYELNSSMASIR